MKKQYVGISRDHSGSMYGLTSAARKDYNDTVQAIKTAAKDNSIDTVVSVTTAGGSVRREIVNSSIDRLTPLSNYATGGGTPLFDSVGELIEIFKVSPDYNNPDVTFLVMAITDGEENQSHKWLYALAPEIKKLQATDRWTFVFRVPHGYGRSLEHMGIPSGNIQEWDQSERGMRESSVATVAAVSNYYSGVSRGIKSTTQFYTTNLKQDQPVVAANMDDISDDVVIYPVKTKSEISSFFALKTKRPYQKGTAFYQLNKTEKAVQDYKIIVVRNKQTGAVFGGGDARALLSLPTSGTIGLKVGDHGDWDIFIQSTSSNRVLVPGTSALYWEKAS